ncbi:hypothetical protein ACJX0J_010960 [Zea mays]
MDSLKNINRNLYILTFKGFKFNDRNMLQSTIFSSTTILFYFLLLSFFSLYVFVIFAMYAYQPDYRAWFNQYTSCFYYDCNSGKKIMVLTGNFSLNILGIVFALPKQRPSHITIAI